MIQPKGDTFLTNKGKRILIIVSALVLMYLVSYILDPFSPYWNNYFKRSTVEIIEDIAMALLFCIAVSESSIRISNKLNKVLPWTTAPGKRFALESLLNILLVLVINSVTILIYIYVLRDKHGGGEGNIYESIEAARSFIQWVFVTVMIAFGVMVVQTGNFLIENWKNSALRTAELNQAVMDAELQSLKLQIDPHFVFNNLSVLSELILDDQQLGYEYAENFSKIYRYLLINSKKNTILLEEELKFLDSYIFLIKQRFGDAVQFEIAIDKESEQLYMPPLTLQLLVENALKHNKTNKKAPLSVHIYTNTQQELKVENDYLPIQNVSNSSGIGLKNIIRRYHLLSDREPRILQDEKTFTVVVPLIRLT